MNLLSLVVLGQVSADTTVSVSLLAGLLVAAATAGVGLWKANSAHDKVEKLAEKNHQLELRVQSTEGHGEALKEVKAEIRALREHLDGRMDALLPAATELRRKERGG